MNMLTHSFCFLPGIGKKKEEMLWESDILSWEQFLRVKKIHGLSSEKKKQYDVSIMQMRRHLLEDDSSSITAVFPKQEHWRLYGAFKEDALFLDIEVDGRGEPTIIGMYDTHQTMIMVRGVTMDKKLFEHALHQKKLLITYNGRSFDMPLLEAYFGISTTLPHIDLHGLCQHIGLKGGLKNIEKELGIPRPEHLYGSPIRLWRSFFASGDQEYLDLLIKYNEEDVINLHPLMEYIYAKLVGEWKTRYVTK